MIRINISNKISNAIQNHKLELPRYQKLYNYYVGQHDILNRRLPDPDKPNNKIVTGYPQVIIDTVVGYFASKPLAYVSKSNNENLLDDLSKIFYRNDEEDTNAEIVKNFCIFGKTYELYWIDKNGEFRFSQYSPLEIYVEKDRRGNVEFAIRYWEDKEEDKTITRVELYNEIGIYYYISNDGENFIIDENEESKEHYFNEVPVSIFQNNNEEIGDFETFIPMIDSLEKMLSDSSNELESWVNAYLILANHEGTQPEDFAKMKQEGVLLLEDVNDAKFLTKDVNTEFQNQFFETIDNLIHGQSATPNMTSEEFSSNLSGVALGFKLFGLESKSSIKERKMEKALRKRIRLICNMLNLQGKEYNPFDIRFNFVRNLPSDESAITDQMTKLSGFIDHETLLSWHPKISEPAQVIKKLNEEKNSIGLDDINFNFLDEENSSDVNSSDE